MKWGSLQCTISSKWRVRLVLFDVVIRLHCVTLRNLLTDFKTKVPQVWASDHPRQPGHLSIALKYSPIKGDSGMIGAGSAAVAV